MTLRINYKQNFERLKSKYNTLENEFQQYKKESIKWSIEDILGTAEEIDYQCNKEQAQEILETMCYKHDAEIGVTWDTIKYYIQEYCSKKLS